MMQCTVLALKMQYSAKQGHKASGSVIVAEKPTPCWRLCFRPSKHSDEGCVALA
jgi:hypothetical protein